MSKEMKRMKNLIKDLYKCRSTLHQAEKALVLFDVGSRYVAIGTDADRLYLTLGWEMTDFADGGMVYSYLFLVKNVATVLDYFRIEWLVSPLVMLFENEQHSIAETQQALDFLRIICKEQILEYPVIGFNTTIKGTGYIRELRLSSLTISKGKIFVCVDNQETIVIVKEHEWNFSDIGQKLMSVLNDILTLQFPYIKSLAQSNKAILKEQKLYNTKVYEAFLNRKSEVSQTTIVVVKMQTCYLTFDDDAILLSQMSKTILYECNTFGLRGRTCAVLTPSQLSSLSSKNIKVSVVSAHNVCALYQMGLKESFLNFKADQRFSYSAVVIRKRIGGDYVVSATFNGSKLPETAIPNYVGGYYFRLPDCKEREALLYAVAHRTYDSLVSSILNE
jgi:hypothetical protein